MNREMRLGINMVPPIIDEGKNSTVINAEYKFAKKRYTERYLWTPSRELEVAIVDAVFSTRSIYFKFRGDGNVSKSLR